MYDYVVLVNEQNESLGTMPKLEAHNKNTPLHRGFSVFLFNENGKLLLQQRSKGKKTWPGVWSNSVCGHPKINESSIEAAKRHLAHELGIKHAEISVVLPNYRYRFEKDGVVENEICPVMTGVTKNKPKPNPEEVEAIQWVTWNKWLSEVQKNSENYSPWAVEETQILSKSKLFLAYLQKIAAQ